jgi:hypothetical protein
VRPIQVLRMRQSATPATPLIDPGTLAPSALYDISDLSTLFQDTAGTTPVTAAGQSVARVNDKSGNGRNLTQVTAANRPTYQIDADGFPYLLFDGTLSGMSVIFAPTLPFDRISALQPVTFTTNDLIYFNTGSTSRMRQVSPSPNVEISEGTGGVVQTTALIPGTNAVVTERHVANASQLAVNQGGYVTGDAGATPPSGSFFVSNPGAATGANFRLYALAVKTGGFSGTDIPGIRAWLGAKCGLVL